MLASPVRQWYVSTRDHDGSSKGEQTVSDSNYLYDDVIKPRSSCDAADPGPAGLQVAETFDQAIFHCGKRRKEAVVEVLLAQLVPDVLNGIEFRRIRGEDHEAEVVGNLEISGAMPFSSVGDQDQLFGRVTGGQFGQEAIHTPGAGLRQDQAIRATFAG